MEGREENPVSKPHTEEEELTPHYDHHQQQQEQQQQPLGLCFLPSSSVDPDRKLDWILPVADDLDQKTTNEEISNQERQKLQLISEDIQNQLKTLVLEQNGEASNEYVDLEGDVDDEFTNQKTLNEELQYQQVVEEGIQDLVLKEKRNENDDDSKGEEGIGYRNRSNRDDDDNYDKSEIEKQDDGAGFVELETGIVAGWNDGRYRRSPYPVRPDAEDCSFYMRTGACKFGSSCKFNHPFRRRNQAAREMVKEKEESPERLGQVECKYYLSSGGCKYGKACRYKHSIRKTPVVPMVELNFLSLPIRPGEMECPFYMRHGSCKYGSNCRFNHPDPTGVVGGDTLSGYGSGGSIPFQGASLSTMSPWSSPRALNDTGPFVPMVFPPTQGVPSLYPERNGSQWFGKDHACPAPSERRLPTPPAFSLNTQAEINFYTPHNHPMIIDEFPQRPGQPECSYFMKTGDCKYKYGCKFHHPKNRLLKTAVPFAPILSDNGLPQRPDQNICSHYNRYGICKFGPACKFDHPVNYGGHSASSSPGFVAPANSFSFGNSATVDDGWE